MKVSIIENGKETIHAINKNEIIIGRSSNCDVQIASENISRKHIAISFANSEYQASLLTPNNWAICMGKEMSVESKIPFFEFGQIELPGDIAIKLILESEETSDTSTMTKKINLEQINNKKKKKLTVSNKKKKEVSSKSSNESNKKIIYIIGAVCLLLLAASYLELL
jgi:hypothetical protein